MKKKFDKAKRGAVRLFDKLRSAPGSRSQSVVPSDPNPFRSDEESTSATPDSCLSTVREETLSAVHELKRLVGRDSANLFLPLKVALVGLVKLVDAAKSHRATDSMLVAFGSRVRAFEKVANIARANDGTDNLRKRLEAIAEAVQHLWAEVGTVAEQVADVGEQESILAVLTALLEVFEFEDNVAIEHRLAIICRLLSSAVPAVVLDDNLTGVIIHNSNTNYAFGSNIVNNNPVNVFQRAIKLSDMEKKEKILQEIRSLIGNQFVHNALHDTQPKEAGCMPGTRQGVLKRFLEWVKNDPKGIFWLAGLAGTGKTSIAITLCRMLEKDPDVLLGGTFFCSHTTNEEARTDVRRILPTLVTLLANRSPHFAAGLLAELKPDMGAVARKPASEQIESLLQQPLAALISEARPIVFVIDALDECNNERELSELLKVISEFRCSARVKFILTSRPETHILRTPTSDATKNSVLQLHTINPEEVGEDIRMYIDYAFSRQALDGDQAWHSEADVRALASLANGLFIFASTAITYILDTDSFDDRTSRLTTVLSTMKDSKVATGPLDRVYEFVITRASNTSTVETHELAWTQLVLACILRARMPLSLIALSELLDIKVDTLRSSLRRLRAVVHVPNEPDKPDLRTLHASFGDYLFERATLDVRIRRSLGDDTLARGCLHLMNKRLHFNVSQSRSSYEPNPSTKPVFIALSFEYACLHWIYHVSDSPESSSHPIRPLETPLGYQPKSIRVGPKGFGNLRIN